MTDHDAQPPPREVVLPDRGGWISGPCITSERVQAQDLEVGDRLVYDGRVVEISDIHHGFYYLRDGREQGLAIGWEAGTSSGLLFRSGSDLLERVASQPQNGDDESPQDTGDRS